MRTATAVVFLLGLLAQFGQAADPIEPWRAVLPGLERNMARADMVVLMPYTSAGAFRLYAPRVSNLRALRDQGAEVVETRFMPEQFGVPFIDIDDVVNEIRSGRDVWVVARSEADELNNLMARVPPPVQQLERAEGGPNGQNHLVVEHWQKR